MRCPPAGPADQIKVAARGLGATRRKRLSLRKPCRSGTKRRRLSPVPSVCSAVGELLRSGSSCLADKKRRRRLGRLVPARLPVATRDEPAPIQREADIIKFVCLTGPGRGNCPNAAAYSSDWARPRAGCNPMLSIMSNEPDDGDLGPATTVTGCCWRRPRRWQIKWQVAQLGPTCRQDALSEPTEYGGRGANRWIRASLEPALSQFAILNYNSPPDGWQHSSSIDPPHRINLGSSRISRKPKSCVRPPAGGAEMSFQVTSSQTVAPKRGTRASS